MKILSSLRPNLTKYCYIDFAAQGLGRSEAAPYFFWLVGFSFTKMQKPLKFGKMPFFEGGGPSVGCKFCG